MLTSRLEHLPSAGSFRNWPGGMDAAIRQRVVMEILGHSQISMTSRYAHVLPQVMTDAADRIGQALWGSAAKRPGKRPG
jgi:integrase